MHLSRWITLAALLLATAAGASPPPALSLPRASLVAADLAILVAQGDALSEAVALAYQRARGIPAANIVRLAVPAGSDSISDADFATLKAEIDSRLPPGVQASLVTWTQPSRVQGAGCAMGVTSVLFYFTGATRLARLESNRFLPGAVADHLSSFAGHLPDARGQMPATAWLAAGATASYGTVEEPCNHAEKFPRASVLIEHYLRGATVIEAYWKSVAWPGQGLFLGDPLARPWAHTPSATVEDGAVVVRTRALRRLTSYQLQFQAAGSSDWRLLDSLSAGQPRPITWRVPLPADAAGGRLRWLGPCPLRPVDRCVLAEGQAGVAGSGGSGVSGMSGRPRY
ncbi:MAG: TIGR03790 family protein [Pseudomonadota bacterium]